MAEAPAPGFCLTLLRDAAQEFAIDGEGNKFLAPFREAQVVRSQVETFPTESSVQLVVEVKVKMLHSRK